MTTNSYIIVEREYNSTWAQIYCVCDGYLKHNGRILDHYYNSQELAEAVVAPGDLWYLSRNCNKPDGHTADRPVSGFSVYFGRDRGDTGTEPHIGTTLAQVWPQGVFGGELAYVWKIGSGWHVGTAASGPGELRLLRYALADV